MEPQGSNPQQLPPQQSQNQTPNTGPGATVAPQQTVQAGYPNGISSPAQTPQPVYAPSSLPPQSLPSRSSKAPLLIVAVVILLAVGIGLAFVLSHGKKNNNAASNTGNTSTTTNSTASFTPASVKACDAFPLTEARTVLGSSAQASSLNGVADTATADQSISSCGYQVTSGTNVTTTSVNLTGALTQKGQTLNAAGFSALKNKDSGTTIAGVGDQAFYDSKTNTLVVLKGSYSIVVTYLAESNGTLSYSQSQAEQIAKSVVAKL